jgi:glycosyltransferase involved in cell wall biosynthesis
MMDSLASQSSPGFEVIVIDQNSDDRLVPIVAHAIRKGVSVRHERMRKVGLSAARNRGITLAKYEIIGFPDDDCWYERDVVEAVQRAFAAPESRDGVVGHWVERGDDGQAANAMLSYKLWRRLRGGNANSITLFFRRSLFAALGGFDERLGLGQWFGAAEETDFVLRALGSGARLRRCDEVRVHHKLTAPPAELRMACANARRRARGTGAIYAKHQLSGDVILRGLVAPIVLPMLRLHGPRAVMHGACTTLGRLEGFLRWHRSQSKDRG